MSNLLWLCEGDKHTLNSFFPPRAGTGSKFVPEYPPPNLGKSFLPLVVVLWIPIPGYSSTHASPTPSHPSPKCSIALSNLKAKHNKANSWTHLHKTNKKSYTNLWTSQESIALLLHKNNVKICSQVQLHNHWYTQNKLHIQWIPSHWRACQEHVL